MITRKSGLLGFVLLGVLLGGCGENRSQLVQKGAKNIPEKKVDYKDPIAVLKVENVFNHVRKTDINGAYVYKLFAYENDKLYEKNGEMFLPGAFVLNAKSSKDLDEAGESIVSYDWNITLKLENQSVTSSACLDTNTSGDRVSIHLCEKAYDDGNMTIGVTVTDDEGVTDPATQVLLFK